VWQQTNENFIRCLEIAFRNFGDDPKTLVVDYYMSAKTALRFMGHNGILQW